MSKINKSVGRNKVSRVREMGRNGECLLLGMGISLWGEEHVLILIMAMVAQLLECSENHWTVHLKWVNYRICKLYLKKFKNMHALVILILDIL